MDLNNMTSVREMFEQLPTERLDEMLDKELHKEPIDCDAIRMIMSILRERDKDRPLEITPRIEEAWEKYQRDIAELNRQKAKRKQIRSWVLKIASTAAILALLVIAIVPQRAEAESFWNRLARWTESVVEFFGPTDNEDRLVNYEFKTDNPGLQEIYDAVVEMGVTEPVVPMWLPEGNELVECKVSETPSNDRLLSRFSDGNGDVIFCVEVYHVDAAHSYQRDETQIIPYELYETEFNIMRNNDVWTVIWTKDNIECSIAIDCQEDTLYRILESIFVWRVNT